MLGWRSWLDNLAVLEIAGAHRKSVKEAAPVAGVRGRGRMEAE